MTTSPFLRKTGVSVAILRVLELHPIEQSLHQGTLTATSVTGRLQFQLHILLLLIPLLLELLLGMLALNLSVQLHTALIAPVMKAACLQVTIIKKLSKQ
jgi:hypothetical protein